MKKICINALTCWGLVLGLILICIPCPPRWISTAILAVIVTASILGNIMIIFHRKELEKYCEPKAIGAVANNIICHIIVPIIILTVFYLKCPSRKGENVAHSILLALGIGLLYAIFMGCGVACSYGLNTFQLSGYITAWVLLVIGLCFIL